MKRQHVTTKPFGREEFKAIKNLLEAGTPAGTERLIEVAPGGEDDILATRYFRLVTPPEVRGNMYLTDLAGEEVKMLTVDQEEATDTIYQADRIGHAFFLIRKFKLCGIANVNLATDREVGVEFKEMLGRRRNESKDILRLS